MSVSCTQDHIIRHYDRSALVDQPSYRAMGWISQFNQYVRFDVINHCIDLDGHDILDVGCGDGELFHYLNEKNMMVQYKGIDVSKEMVKRAMYRYPGLSVRKCNVFDYSGSHSIVVSSGAFNICPNDAPLAHLSNVIDHLLGISTQHVVFNLLSQNAHEKDAFFTYYCPNEVLKLCLKKTSYVSLNHSYLPHDFTVHLVKES